MRWENLDTPPASRFLRRSVTNMLATMLILVTLLFLILCQTKRDVRHLLAAACRSACFPCLCLCGSDHACSYVTCRAVRLRVVVFVLAQEFREYVFPNKNLCNLHIPAALHGQYIDIEEPLLVRNPTCVPHHTPAAALVVSLWCLCVCVCLRCHTRLVLALTLVLSQTGQVPVPVANPLLVPHQPHAGRLRRVEAVGTGIVDACRARFQVRRCAIACARVSFSVIQVGTRASSLFFIVFFCVFGRVRVRVGLCLDALSLGTTRSTLRRFLGCMTLPTSRAMRIWKATEKKRT